jgi:CheY-like chemotaxis protein
MDTGMSTSRILVIDDEKYLTQLFALLLWNAGYTVREENCPFAAIASAQEFRPDLILLDVEMPGKNGRELAFEFQLTRELAAIPVIFVSGHTMECEQAARDGNGYLEKPFGEQTLLSTVRQFCPKREISTCA